MAQTFTDNDGTEYPVRSILSFSEADWIEFAKRERKLYRGHHKMALLGRAEDEDRQQALAADTVRLLDESADEIIQFLIPSMPVERVREIAFAHKVSFYLWWKAQQPSWAVPATQAIETKTA